MAIPPKRLLLVKSLLLWTAAAATETLRDGGIGQTQDISIGVIDASLNSAFRTYDVAGAMDFDGRIGDRSINTSILKSLLPCAYSACPECPIEASIVVLEAPTVSLSATSGASVTAPNGLIKMSTNGTVIASMSASGAGNLSIFLPTGSKFIKVNLTVTSLATEIQSVCDGHPVSPGLKSSLEGLIGTVVRSSLVPYLNSDKFPGIPVPVIDGFNLLNPTVHVEDSIVVVGADLQNPSEGLITPGNSNMSSDKENLKTSNTISSPAFATHFMRGRAGLANDGDFKINASISAVNKVLQSVVPELRRKITSLVIPAESGKTSGITWSTSATNIQDFGIGEATITSEEGVGLSLKLSGLKMSLPRTSFKLSKRIIVKVGCSGHFQGSISDTSAIINLAVTRSNTGAPVVKPTSEWKWGKLSVSAKLDNIVCKVVKDVVQIFEGNIDEKIRDTIEAAVPPALNKVIADKANTALAQLTQRLNVDQYASIAMALAKDPVFSSGDIELSLLGVWGPPKSFDEPSRI